MVGMGFLPEIAGTALTCHKYVYWFMQHPEIGLVAWILLCLDEQGAGRNLGAKGTGDAWCT